MHRAGRCGEAAAVIDRLGEPRIDADLTRALFDFSINRREIDLAVRLIERVPGTTIESARTTSHWMGAIRRRQRTPAIAARAGADRADLARELTSAKRAGFGQRFVADIQRYDWRAANQTWSDLMWFDSSPLDRAFDLSSTPWAMIRLAEVAAHQRDGQEAQRFWRAAVNFDRAVGLERLSWFPPDALTRRAHHAL
ncbi:MAG TPA: hypothetical protein VH740_22140 [Vicinamibacterales bacterium]